jgi:glutamate synthase (NADPH/NADH) large chain
MGALPEGRLTVRLEGSCGQSLGAFSVQGITLDVLGDANDYVGKGLSGATIQLRPAPGSGLKPEDNTIIGNTCLYGATSGYLFASGQAGERFAVRNSGASAVIEGCGSNGCEYMTGGTVVILGAVGANFAAGMTGGMAFVYDPAGELPRRINPEAVVWRRVSASYWRTLLEDLVEQHLLRTGSPRAKSIMDHFDDAVGDFWQIVPKEMIKRLAQPLDDAA